MPTSVFASHTRKYWPYVYEGEIVVDHLVGGTPGDEKAIAGWLRTRLGMDRGDLLVAAVQEVVADRVDKGQPYNPDEAIDEVAKKANLNGFKADEHGLYIEGRHLKACIKEATNVAVAAGNIKKGRAVGETNKSYFAFVAEHIMVIDTRLHLDRDKADNVQQRFVSTFRGTGIQYEEYCEDVPLPFTIETDYLFSDEFWEAMWTTAERQGIGATRSQGYGRFTLTKWDRKA